MVGNGEQRIRGEVGLRMMVQVPFPERDESALTGRDLAGKSYMGKCTPYNTVGSCSKFLILGPGLHLSSASSQIGPFHFAFYLINHLRYQSTNVILC